MSTETLRNILGDAYGRLILMNHPDTSKEQKEFFMQTIEECKKEFVRISDEKFSNLAKNTDWTNRKEFEKLIKKFQEKLAG